MHHTCSNIDNIGMLVFVNVTASLFVPLLLITLLVRILSNVVLVNGQ